MISTSLCERYNWVQRLKQTKKKKKVKSADVGLDRRDVLVAPEKNTLQITGLDSTSMELLLSLLQGKHEYVTESVGFL